MIFELLIGSLMLIGLIVGIYLMIKEARQSPKITPVSELPQSAEVFATFSFTDEEWKQVYQQEFIDDEKGKGFLDRFLAVIKYDSVVRDKKVKEICFTPQSIYVSDGNEGKLYKLNQLNSFGNGIHLSSIRLLNLSPLKKIQVKLIVDSVDADLNLTRFDLEYLVPIPRSADAKIDEILKTY